MILTGKLKYDSIKFIQATVTILTTRGNDLRLQKSRTKYDFAKKKIFYQQSR